MGDLAAQSIWLVPTSAIVGVFTFITVLAWVGEKRKERESFYRSEVLKKIADNPGDAARNVLELMSEQERSTERRVREGMKLGGLITAAVGGVRSRVKVWVSRRLALLTVVMVPVAAASGWAMVQVPLQVPQASALPSSHTSGPLTVPSPQYGPVRLSVAAQVALQSVQVGVP